MVSEHFILFHKKIGWVLTMSQDIKPKKHYGIYKNQNGELCSFIVDHSVDVPNPIRNKILTKRTTRDDPEPLVNELLNYYNQYRKISPKNIGKPENKIGKLCDYADGDKIHSAISVGYYNNEYMLLFLTSSNAWNPFARPIKEEEASFFLWSNRNKTTYLAPVLRSARYITWNTDRRFPNHRVLELYKEFFENKIDKILKY